MENNNNKKIMDMLQFDALAEAEKMTGQSYKQDNLTTKLGFAMHIQHNQMKTTALKEISDTYFGIKFDEFTELIESRGFERVYEETFTDKESVEPQTLCLWADATRGFLIVAETYYGSLNSGKLYGEVRLKEGVKYLSVSCSNGPIHSQKEEALRSFDLDVREGLFTKLQGIEKEAEFLPTWEETNKFLWLLNFDEKNGAYDYKKNAFMKLSKTPENVQKMVRLSERDRNE